MESGAKTSFFSFENSLQGFFFFFRFNEKMFSFYKTAATVLLHYYVQPSWLCHNQTVAVASAYFYSEVGLHSDRLKNSFSRWICKNSRLKSVACIHGNADNIYDMQYMHQHFEKLVTSKVSNLATFNNIRSLFVFGNLDFCYGTVFLIAKK